MVGRQTSHYLPRFLFSAQPGDLVVATLKHERRTWLVTIRDTTSGRQAVFSTKEEGQGPYNLAEWAQEKSSVRWLSYPHLSPVTFRQVLVNGSPPNAGHLFSVWLSTPEGLLAPTPLSGDAFRLVPTTIVLSVLSTCGSSRQSTKRTLGTRTSMSGGTTGSYLGRHCERTREPMLCAWSR